MKKWIFHCMKILAVLAAILLFNSCLNVLSGLGGNSGCMQKAAELADKNAFDRYFEKEPDAKKPDDPLLAVLWEYHPDGFYIIHRMEDVTIPGKVIINSKVASGQLSWKNFIVHKDFDGQLFDLGVAVHEMNQLYNLNYASRMLRNETGPCPDQIYTYYIDRQLTIMVVPNWRLHFSAAELKNVIPESLQTKRFNPYINEAIDTNGIYSLLDEFDAYRQTCLCDIRILSSPEGQNTTMTVSSLPGMATAYAEFKYYILTMLIYAKEKHPEFYEDILKNTPFRRTFTIIDDRYFRIVQEINEAMGFVDHEYEILMQEMEKPAYKSVLALLRTHTPDDSGTDGEFNLSNKPPKTYGGNNDDFGACIQKTTDGGYIMCGATKSSGAGGWDVYLVKTDARGNPEWEKTHGGKQDDTGIYIKQTKDGGYIICGWTGSESDYVADAYLLKTDRNGNREWEKTFARDEYDAASSVVQTSDGGYLLCGTSGDIINGRTDIYVIKTDSKGGKQWEKTFGGDFRDFGRSVIQTKDNGFIVCGTYSGKDLFDFNTYMLKLDSTGNKEWEKIFGDAKEDEGASVLQTSDGGFIICGYNGAYDRDDGKIEGYIVKTDSRGNKEWEKVYRGEIHEALVSIAETKDGGYIACGATCPLGDEAPDLYLMKIDARGKMEWEKTFGGTGEDVGVAVLQTDDGGFIICGTTESFGAGNADVFLIRTDSKGDLIKE